MATKLTKTELKSLQSALNIDKYNDVVDEIKLARNGQFPSDWMEMVLFGDYEFKVSEHSVIQVVDGIPDQRRQG